MSTPNEDQERAPAPAGPEDRTPPAAPPERPTKLFVTGVLGAFSYPFRGGGKYIMIAGALSIFVVQAITLFIPFGFIFALLFWAIVAAYLADVIRDTAAGESEPPGWPDITDPLDDILVPAFLLTATTLVWMSPALVYAVKGESENVFWLLLAGGMLFLPISLVAVVLYRSLAGLNPLVIFRGIVRIGPAYPVVCLAFAGAVWLDHRIEAALSARSQWAGYFLASVVGFYFLVVEMRILGLIYRAYRYKLDWFPED